MATNEFQDTEEDTLSLSDLPLEELVELSDQFSHIQITNPIRLSDQHLFEFSGDFSSEMSPIDNILFCGKQFPHGEDELNEYEKRDYFSIRSTSFQWSRDEKIQICDDDSRKLESNSNLNSRSIRFARSEYSQSSRSLVKYDPSPSPVQKVNITAITTMSAKWRRRMFMFGPVKFKPEMELSSIRKRQSRRSPSSMFPAEVTGGELVAAAGNGGKGSLWRLLKPVRCRSQLINMLAKSFSCISPSVL